MPLTLHDIFGTLAGFATVPFLLLFPGFAIGWIADVAGFRSKSGLTRIAWAVAISFSVSPLIAYLIEKDLNLAVASWVFVFLSIAGIYAWRRSQARPRPSGWLRPTVVVCLWTLFALLILTDVVWNGRLFASTPVVDHSYRVEFVRSLAQYGLPAVNPLYYPGTHQPLHYYYFWYALIALPVRYLGIDPRCMLIASCIAAGIGVMCVVLLYAREFLVEKKLERIALALLAVTGLDILPTLANLGRGLPLRADLEWWSPDQVASWMDTFLWVPHHTAGLIGTLTTILLLWKSRERAGVPRFACLVIAAAGLASTTGLSIYLGICAVFLLILWIPWTYFRDKNPRAAFDILFVLILAGIFVMPFMAELRSPTGPAQHVSSIPLELGVRQPILPSIILRQHFMEPLMRTIPNVTNWVFVFGLLIPGYFTEFGAFGIAYLVWTRRIFKVPRNTEPTGNPWHTAMFLCTCALLITTFVRSNAISNNDFGFRTALIVQFFCLFFMARLILDWKEKGSTWQWKPVFFAVLLGIGLVSTICQAAILRGFIFLYPDRTVTADQMRSAYGELKTVASPDAVVEWEPQPPMSEDDQPARLEHALHMLYASHQTAAADEDCGAPFGGNGTFCTALLEGQHAIFKAGSADDAKQFCSRWGIDYLIATSSNDAWADNGSWVWKLPVTVERPRVRILHCAK